jgi:HlyD family secretion protein
VKADILSSSAPLSSRERRSNQPARPARYWRLSLTVSLGVLLLLASLVTVAWTLRSHASPTSSSVPAANDGMRWSSLGFVDLKDGVTPLYPLQQGRVTSIEAKENEPIKSGTPLFHLDDTVQVSRARQAQSALKGAEASLAIAQAKVEQASKHIEAQKTAIAAAQKNVEKARLDRDKKKELLQKQLSDKETLQAAEVTLEQAKLAVKGEERKLAIAEAAQREAEAYVAAARAGFEAKKAQLDEANHAVNECVLRAPVDGTPLRILVAKGQVLGSNPRQPAVEFAAEGPLLVRAEVEQEFVNDVQPGQEVLIEDNVTGEQVARGKVASIANWYAPRRSTLSADVPGLTNDVRTLECIIHLESQLKEIRIHQRVRVRFPRAKE